MKRLLFAALLLAASIAPAAAQNTVKLCYIVQSGNNFVCTDVSSTNPLPVSASVSASISPFTPGLSGARGTPLTVTTSDSSGNLPTNTGSVIVSNVGSNPMYCNVNGVAATTSDQLITSGGGWFDFGIPVGTTTLHCIATGSSTTANTVGGSGLGAGTGGGLLANPGTAANWGIGATGSAVPANAQLVGGTDGTNTRAVATDTLGNQKVINGASTYQAEPASTSITALTGGGGGATGDYLSHCTVIPTTTSPGVFTITDNSTAIYSFPGGASSLSNLVPWTIPVGAKSSSGAWKVTTGAGLSIVCVGRFT